MNIVLLGAPGSGKGTLGAQLSQEYKIPHISSGDIVRQEVANKTPLGLKVKALIAEGKLLSDTPEQMGELFDLIQWRVTRPDARHGFILDGVPRTLWQAERLYKLFSYIGRALDAAILLETDDETVVKRLSSRVSCSACKRIYSVTEVCCPGCSSIYSEQREDDKPEVVQRRLDIYRNTIQPVINLYTVDRVLLRINGNNRPEEVIADTKAALFPVDHLKLVIPSYPSSKKFPFYNLVEMYKKPMLVRHVVNVMTQKLQELQPDYLAAPEARALPIFGALLYQINKPGIFIRKAGKLPEGARKLTAHYTTAYSSDTLEMNYADLKGKTVAVIDDGISSGGTTLAMIQLLQSAGAEVVGILATVRYRYREPELEYQSWESKTFTLFELGV